MFRSAVKVGWDVPSYHLTAHVLPHGGEQAPDAQLEAAVFYDRPKRRDPSDKCKKAQKPRPKLIDLVLCFLTVGDPKESQQGKQTDESIGRNRRNVTGEAHTVFKKCSNR